VSRIRIKFCGVTNPADAAAAAAAGADAVGMIVHAKSKRLIDLPTAAAVVAALPPYVASVGVFVDASAEQVRNIVAGANLTAAQLHGDETPQIAAACGGKVIKAIRVDEKVLETLAIWRNAIQSGVCKNVIGLLLETAVAGQSGGTGVANDFEGIAKLKAYGAFHDLPPILLSGGLTPENVSAAASLVRPYAVDVSSGIEESLGKKSVEKMTRFAAAVASL